MKGHKHIGALEKDVKRALRTGASFDLLLEVYRYSFMMLEVQDPESFISQQMLQVAKEQQPKTYAITYRKEPFSTNEMDYGTPVFECTYNDLSTAEKEIYNEA